VTPPVITPCSIINIDLAECTHEKGAYFDKKISQMLGYTCFSPEDTGELKKYIKKTQDVMSF